MTALILDGKTLAASWEEQLTNRVTALKSRSNGRTPILATILVGDDPASATYVKMKGKDVDGVTCLGFGRMAMGEEAYGCATPKGIMRILEHYKIGIEGKHAVVVGRSAILGKPMAMMLLEANATVTICHSRTQNLPALIKQADILVGAVGKPEFIKAEWIKDGAVVVDAGYHPGGVGDIELAPLVDRVSAYTPVPGGVGPMTINTLIFQSVDSGEKAIA